MDILRVSNRQRLLKGFDGAGRNIFGELSECYGEEAASILIVRAGEEYERILPKIAEIGEKKVLFSQFIIWAGWISALYKALLCLGEGKEKALIVIEDSCIAYLTNHALVLRLFGKMIFTRLFTLVIRNLAAESLSCGVRRGFLLKFVEGNGDFSFGFDVVSCPICKLYQQEGADELLPLFCELDYTLAKIGNWTLDRTDTITQGKKICNHRFKKPIK